VPESIQPHPERAALAPLLAALTQVAGDHFLEAVAAQDMDEIALRPGGLLAVVERLRAAGFNHLLDIGGTDHHPLTPRFEVSYHLTAIPVSGGDAKSGRLADARQFVNVPRMRLRVFPDDQDPVIPSLMQVWPSADWAEREVFDLFGVRFEGHTNLRRLLNPDDFRGYPLRKDFPLRGLERRFVPGGRVGAIPPVKEE
jgi:NADH-quinone oxidoreductase subunit C